MSVRLTYRYLSCALLLSLILGVLVYFKFNFYEIKGFEKALDGVLLLSSISLGFYGACLSVFASLFNTETVKSIMNELDFRKEFLIIASLSLGIGFLTVLNTIIYQVILENQMVPTIIFRFTNAFWVSIVLMYFSLQLIFIFVTFTIFFNNGRPSTNEKVFTPHIDETKLK